jgi:hypothetical protein
MVSGLVKWLRDARTVHDRLVVVLKKVESLKGEQAEKSGTLKSFLIEMCEVLPRMIEIMEGTVREIASI